MHFCTESQLREFWESVPEFEAMLIREHIHLMKYYLDISKSEQAERLEDRIRDPLKQWKSSPLDAIAQERWDDYSRARDEMLQRTHNPTAPWTIVRANHKHRARKNVLRDLLSRLDYEGRDTSLLTVDRDVVFEYPGGPPADGLLKP
jgi:polyphosphate kinase